MEKGKDAKSGPGKAGSPKRQKRSTAISDSIPKTEPQPPLEVTDMAANVDPNTADAEQYATKLQDAEAILREAELRKQQEKEFQRKVAEARTVLAQHQQALVQNDPQLDAGTKAIASHAKYAAAAGAFVPGGFDVPALLAIQLRMVWKLAAIFNIPLSGEAGKTTLAAVGGMLGYSILGSPAAGLVKLVPLVGSLAGPVGFSSAAFSTTYAIGKVFLAHFASGGNLLNFDPVRAKQLFGEAVKQGVSTAPSSTAA